jgi:Carboxypeptidase regulatory-like domain
MVLRIQSLSHCIVAMLLLATGVTVGQTQPRPTNASNTGSITGKVVNESGQPLPNASVWANAIGAQAAGQQIVTSDQEGKFKLTGLQRVPYHISASMPAYLSAPRGREEQGKYEIGESVTLVLVKGGVITGKVSTPDGEPVVAIAVRAEMTRDANGRRLNLWGGQESPTDDRGIYRIYGLPAGTYIVIVGGGTNEYSRTGINAFDTNVPTYAPSSTRDDAAEINLRAGEELTDVDIRYRAEPGRSISGTISGTVREDGGFTLTLTSIGDGGAQRDQQLHQDANHREFVLTGNTDGDYYLTAHTTTQSGEWVVSDSKLIKIRGADVTGIELVTQPLASINGRVMLDDTKVAECTDKQRPVFTETSVAAWHKVQAPGKDRARFIWSLGQPVRADAEGNVKLRNLAAGEYRFVSQFSGKDWYLRSISFAASDAMKTWTRVKPGDRLSGLTVTLARGAASFSGKIVAGEGETVPEKSVVYLVPVEREKADEVLRFYAAQVDGDGKVGFNNIAPGRYWILAQPLIDGTESPLTKFRLPDETETRLRLRRVAEAAKTEVELKPCQNVADFQIKP